LKVTTPGDEAALFVPHRVVGRSDVAQDDIASDDADPLSSKAVINVSIVAPLLVQAASPTPVD
jgi:hypothetical protein